MDQILTLNDSWTERRTVPTKTAPSYNNSPSTHLPTKNYDQTFVLDSLLEDLATMRNQKALPQRPPQERLHQAPVIRRVKFQTPNGTLVPPMHYNTLNGKSSTFEVALAKDPYYEDFGFSLSDGAFERGVYVNRVRPSGPAENIGLKPCDQILKVGGFVCENWEDLRVHTKRNLLGGMVCHWPLKGQNHPRYPTPKPAFLTSTISLFEFLMGTPKFWRPGKTGDFRFQNFLRVCQRDKYSTKICREEIIVFCAEVPKSASFSDSSVFHTEILMISRLKIDETNEKTCSFTKGHLVHFTKNHDFL